MKDNPVQRFFKLLFGPLRRPLLYGLCVALVALVFARWDDLLNAIALRVPPPVQETGKVDTTDVAKSAPVREALKREDMPKETSPVAQKTHRDPSRQTVAPSRKPPVKTVPVSETQVPLSEPDTIRVQAKDFRALLVAEIERINDALKTAVPSQRGSLQARLDSLNRALRAFADTTKTPMTQAEKAEKMLDSFRSGKPGKQAIKGQE